MKNFNIRFSFLAVLLVLFSMVVFFVQYKKPFVKKKVDIYKLPLEIGEWKAKEIPVDEEVKKILETDSVLIREYSNGKDSVWVSLVYYEDSRVALHLPEGCGLGQGSRIIIRDKLKVSPVELEPFEVVRLVFTSPRGKQVMLYYFENGNIRTSSYTKLRFDMMKNKILSKSSRCALVRVSAPVEISVEKTENLLRSFIEGGFCGHLKQILSFEI